jgi:hypothetical protein
MHVALLMPDGVNLADYALLPHKAQWGLISAMLVSKLSNLL